MTFRPAGLKRPKIDPRLAERIPPGQYLTSRWPVLHDGDVPGFDPTTWDLRIFGHVERELTLDWEQFQHLPTREIQTDMHCVTRWSSLDLRFEGVPVSEVLRLAGVRPGAAFVMFHGEAGYTANVPLAAATADDALLALHENGEPLSPAHGFPVRVIIPSRYAWKSTKWLRGVEVLTEDRPGFWEQHGYHMNGDFLKEERFSDDAPR